MQQTDDSNLAWGPRLRPTIGEEPNTQAGRTAQSLRQDITRNKLKPGERLLFDKTRKRYGVGLSPLREALFQLAAQGLVIPEGHKGFRVAPICIEEMLDISSLRAALEERAVRASIKDGDDEWETSVVAAFHRLAQASGKLEAQAETADRERAEDDWERRHREFHFSLCAACGSPWLLHFANELYDQLERYRRYFWSYPERVSIANAEHEMIMQAVVNRDADRAAELLKEHFRHQAQVTISRGRRTVQVPALAIGS